MRKIIFLGMLLSSLGLMSVSAQNWEQFINRTNMVSEAVIQAIYDPTFRMEESNIRIAAVLASHVWCRKAYLHISNNCPGLTQQQRNWYLANSEIHRVEEEKLDEILEYASTPTYNDIIDKYNKWGMHIDKGGTIDFKRL